MPTVVLVPQVQAGSKFVDLGADSLDTVSIIRKTAAHNANSTNTLIYLALMSSQKCTFGFAGGNHDGFGGEV